MKANSWNIKYIQLADKTKEYVEESVYDSVSVDIQSETEIVGSGESENDTYCK